MSNANDLCGVAIAGVRSSDGLAGPRSGPEQPGVSGGTREAQLRIGGSPCRMCEGRKSVRCDRIILGLWKTCPRCQGTGSETAAAASGPANIKMSDGGTPFTPSPVSNFSLEDK